MLVGIILLKMGPTSAPGKPGLLHASGYLSSLLITTLQRAEHRRPPLVPFCRTRLHSLLSRAHIEPPHPLCHTRSHCSRTEARTPLTPYRIACLVATMPSSCADGRHPCRMELREPSVTSTFLDQARMHNTTKAIEVQQIAPRKPRDSNPCVYVDPVMMRLYRGAQSLREVRAPRVWQRAPRWRPLLARGGLHPPPAGGWRRRRYRPLRRRRWGADDGG